MKERRHISPKTEASSVLSRERHEDQVIKALLERICQGAGKGFSSAVFNYRCANFRRNLTKRSPSGVATVASIIQHSDISSAN